MGNLMWIFLLAWIGTIEARELRAGDVLLQPMKCYLCRMIEEHENSSFAHMGVVVKAGVVPLVAESLGDVHVMPLEKFLAKGDKSRPVLVRRLVEQVEVDWEEAVRPYLGASYDDDFLWDNVDAQGRELLYCSELVTKLFNGYLRTPFPTKIMNYDLNRELWERYFRRSTPDGLPGNSPGDFEHSPLLESVGTYQDGVWNWM
jgi:hypothetical protein